MKRRTVKSSRIIAPGADALVGMGGGGDKMDALAAVAAVLANRGLTGLAAVRHLLSDLEKLEAQLSNLPPTSAAAADTREHVHATQKMLKQIREEQLEK